VIFIDTGEFVARYRASDDWHKSALDGWGRLERSKRQCFTSNFVIAETLKLVAWYAGHDWAVRIGRQIISSAEIRVLSTGVNEELEGIDIMEKFVDQKIGFVDCLSMALMRRHRLISIFSFDKHFELAGFKLWPVERR